MKIIYGQNPLAAKVILTEAEKKELWYKIKITQLEDLVFNTYYYLQDKNFNLVEAKQDIDSFVEDDTKEFDKHVNLLHACMISSLTSSHVGDCICLPCSCIKCQAEDMLGITTIALQPSRVNAYIAEAFQHVDTLDAAILFLENQINVSASCLHKTDKKAALDYCNNYKNINFYNG